MPAPSKAMRRAAAIAEHEPEKLYKRNKGLAKMSKKQLHEFASTPEKGLPKKSAAEQKGKAKVHGSGAFSDKDMNQGYKNLGPIVTEPDKFGTKPGDTVQLMGDVKESSTGTPIDQGQSQAPGFETSATIQSPGV